MAGEYLAPDEPAVSVAGYEHPLVLPHQEQPLVLPQFGHL